MANISVHNAEKNLPKN